ncbi:MAG: mechanosensitive ion channel family protein [Elainellaceae cyanobacterium]
MTESVGPDLSYFWRELLEASIVLQRPVVQIQLGVIVVAMAIAWLLSRLIWLRIGRPLPKLGSAEQAKSQISWRQYGIAAARYLSTPTLGLVTVSLLRTLFEQWGWFAGYLADSLTVLGEFWVYRLFISFLFLGLPASFARRSRQIFFGPLFFFYEAGRVLGWFFDLSALSQVTLVNLFDEPVRLEAAFVTVAGLYFWTVGVFFLEDLFLTLLRGRSLREPKVVQVVSLLTRYSLIGLGIVLVFGYVGVSSSAVAAITGGLSVGIGFGLKEVIGNFVSGIWLLFEGALKPGDIVKVDGQVSQVVKLGIRATTVQVVQDNSEEIIPNQTFFTQNVSTFTGSNSLMALSLVVGASYSCSPSEVVAVLREVADQNPKVLANPAPRAFALGFGESSVDFELKFWIDDPLTFKVMTSQLVCEVWQAFAKNGIEIPYPQRDLNVRALPETNGVES